MNLGFLKKGRDLKKRNGVKNWSLIKSGKNKPKFSEIHNEPIKKKIEVFNSVTGEVDYDWHPNEGF